MCYNEELLTEGRRLAGQTVESYLQKNLSEVEVIASSSACHHQWHPYSRIRGRQKGVDRYEERKFSFASFFLAIKGGPSAISPH